MYFAVSGSLTRGIRPSGEIGLILDGLDGREKGEGNNGLDCINSNDIGKKLWVRI